MKKKVYTAAEIGRLGGLSKSEKKASASRLNGLLGGAPKKTGVKNEKDKKKNIGE